MLPTRPRPLERSMRSSCTTPAATTATRVSRGVTLIRISSLTSTALRDVLRAQRLEAHLGARKRALHPVVVLERDRGKHLVRAAGELLEHFRRVLAVHRLLVDVALEGDG